MKILVAEDEPDILLFYKLILENEGHQVVATKNGEECLDEYNKNRDLDGGFGLVILDYRMPGKNGMEVAREIVRMVPSQTLLMVTAFSGVLEMEEKPVDMKILPKPFDPDQLVHTVNRLLSSQEAA
jgi:two-component system cell cycle response regulator CpdR